MTVVTQWFRVAEDGGLDFNHIEMGYGPATEPTPVSELQRAAWRNARWLKKCAALVAGTVRSTPRNRDKEAAAFETLMSDDDARVPIRWS